jgi:hypothetical protein
MQLNAVQPVALYTSKQFKTKAGSRFQQTAHPQENVVLKQFPPIFQNKMKMCVLSNLSTQLNEPKGSPVIQNRTKPPASPVCSMGVVRTWTNLQQPKNMPEHKTQQTNQACKQ